MSPTNDDDLLGRVETWRKQTGAVPGAFDCWLAHRSIATLDLRLARQSANAAAIAELLGRAGRTCPGCAGRACQSDPSFAVARAQMRRIPGIVSLRPGHRRPGRPLPGRRRAGLRGHLVRRGAHHGRPAGTVGRRHGARFRAAVLRHRGHAWTCWPTSRRHWTEPESTRGAKLRKRADGLRFRHGLGQFLRRRGRRADDRARASSRLRVSGTVPLAASAGSGRT